MVQLPSERDYHARVVASDGRDTVVVTEDAIPRHEPWVEVWIGKEAFLDEPLSSATDRLDALARMFLDAADELRKLAPSTSGPTSLTRAGSGVQTMREAMRLSLRDLARRAAVSPGYLSLVERGRRDPSERWPGQVARAMAEHMTERTA
jgi:Helix-turn-helix domain